MKIKGIGLIVILGMTIVNSAAGQQATASEQPASAKTKIVQQSQPAGMVVVKDPDGALRAPTAAEAAALQPRTQSRLTARSSKLQSGPASGVMMVLDPATSNVYSVMTKGPDGKLKLECVSGQATAESLMKRGVAAAPAPGETASEK